MIGKLIKNYIFYAKYTNCSKMVILFCFSFSEWEKYIATVEGGMVIVGTSEQDSGRYDCHLAGALLCTFNLSVDAHRCSPPAGAMDYHQVYSNWCHEFQKYKSAMKSWEKKQAVSAHQSYSKIYIVILYLWRCHNTNVLFSMFIMILYYIYIRTSLDKKNNDNYTKLSSKSTKIFSLYILRVCKLWI